MSDVLDLACGERRPFTALHQIQIQTQQRCELIDITDGVAELVCADGEWDGTACIYSQHTTAAIRIQEDEPLLLQDLQEFLMRLAPPFDHYGHNDFERRLLHMEPGERPNGHAHCLHLLLGASSTVPVLDGSLQLGRWQRIFLVELDGPRLDRQVLVALNGSTARMPDNAGIHR